MRHGYTGWQLSSHDKAKLLTKFKPQFPDVIAHHVTYQRGVPETAELPVATTIRVVGHCVDPKGVECLVVEIDGCIRRADSSTYHITWSIDRSAGYKPVHSNEAIANYGFTPVDPAINIAVNAQFFPSS